MPIVSCLRRPLTAAVIGVLLALFVCAPGARAAEGTFSKVEVLSAADAFFGGVTKGLAEVVEKVFSDLGEPNAYIIGEEVSGAFIFGLRYGKGELNRKGQAGKTVYWQGPSVGFDFGGNASKSFVLVYNLADAEALYQRYPSVDGSFYFVAGVGVNYQRAGDTTLAPIRTGIGLRFGGNLGYVHYTKDVSVMPF
jgi:hypothetical protein